MAMMTGAPRGRGSRRSGHGRRVRALATIVFLGVATTAVVIASSAWRTGRATPSRAEAAPEAVHTYPFVYVAIGASDSYGVGVDPTQSWPAVLARHLPAGTHFVNLGVPGILLHRALEIELPVTLDAHPNLVTVWLAVNDLAAGVPLASYQQNLNVLLGTLRRETGARVLVANVPDLTLVPAFTDRPGLDATLAAWNAAIADAAHRHGAILVDLYARWRELAQHPEYIGPDGLHPSVAGYQRLAALFWQAYAQTR